MDVEAVRKFAATFVTDTTNPPSPRPRWLLWRGRFDLVEIADAITALICFAVADGTLGRDSAEAHLHHPAGLLLLLSVLIAAPLVLRTRFPLIAWVGSALSFVFTDLAFSIYGFGFVAAGVLVYGLCLYAVTVRCRPRIVVAAAAVTLIGAAFFDPTATAAIIFLTAVPLLLGAVVRQRRSGELRLAQQELRHSGERALLEERQRIARELHDVVAHHMSVIAIQAEAAPYKTADPPPELVESFGDIRASALAGLTELRRVLGVLRAEGQTTAPQPGLAELDVLLDSARNGGVSVTATRSGDATALPEGVDLSAYRIVQEALSNAMRHAPGSNVQVHVGFRPDGLDLDVRNDPGRAGPDHTGQTAGGGHGIIGMRERAAMLGGSLNAGPTKDGGFLVTAILPTTTEGQGDAAISPDGQRPDGQRPDGQGTDRQGDTP